MKQYKELLQYILDNGVKKEDRTGTGTLSIFGYNIRINLSKGFPLLTTKKMFTKGIIEELLWFLSGETNIKPLVDKGVNIWVADAYREYCNKVPKSLQISREQFVEEIKKDVYGFARNWGQLGPVYGAQWRKWTKRDVYGIPQYIDQISVLIDKIRTNPNDRRLIVSAWNIGDLDKMVLPPCHYAFQCYVNDGKLSLMWQQRSVDTFLGLPFNIASYAFLTHMIAQQCNLEVGDLIFCGGDVHLYLNHLELAELQLTREERELPRLILKRKPESIFDYKFEDFEIVEYNPHPIIKADISV